MLRHIIEKHTIRFTARKCVAGKSHCHHVTDSYSTVCEVLWSNGELHHYSSRLVYESHRIFRYFRHRRFSIHSWSTVRSKGKKRRNEYTRRASYRVSYASLGPSSDFAVACDTTRNNDLALMSPIRVQVLYICILRSRARSLVLTFPRSATLFSPRDADQSSGTGRATEIRETVTRGMPRERDERRDATTARKSHAPGPARRAYRSQ